MSPSANCSSSPHQRPLSPHIQVYRPQLTSILSILHRLTGVALSFALPVVVYWLWALAYGYDEYEKAYALLTSWWMQILGIGWAFSFYYHFCNGIRHWFWDVGYGYDLKTTYTSGWGVVVASIAFTILTTILLKTGG